MTELINKQKKDISLKTEKIKESEKIIQIVEAFIMNENLVTSDMLKAVKNHCEKLIISDF